MQLVLRDNWLDKGLPFLDYLISFHIQFFPQNVGGPCRANARFGRGRNEWMLQKGGDSIARTFWLIARFSLPRSFRRQFWLASSFCQSCRLRKRRERGRESLQHSRATPFAELGCDPAISRVELQTDVDLFFCFSTNFLLHRKGRHSQSLLYIVGYLFCTMIHEIVTGFSARWSFFFETLTRALFISFSNKVRRHK